MPYTTGVISRRGVVATVDCPPVALLKRAGAIPMGVTNTPELCMWCESHNHLYGITNNPYDFERTAGGSSGQKLLTECRVIEHVVDVRFRVKTHLFRTANKGDLSLLSLFISSGGEGSILGAAGAVIGVGSDIGGSIRMPCFFNGIFGHKTTPGERS